MGGLAGLTDLRGESVSGLLTSAFVSTPTEDELCAESRDSHPFKLEVVRCVEMACMRACEANDGTEGGCCLMQGAL